MALWLPVWVSVTLIERDCEGDADGLGVPELERVSVRVREGVLLPLGLPV